MTLFIVSILLVLGSAVSIWFGAVAKENTIYGIIGEIASIDLQTYIFAFGLALGILLFLFMGFGMGISFKRYCCPHWVFALFMTLFLLFFLLLGISLTAIAVVSADELEKLCDSQENDSDFQKALSELYTRADSFYGVTPNGCRCVTGTYIPAGKTGVVATDTGASDIVNKVQECTSYLESAYSDYNIDFSDINDIITYLDYFGEIENDYDCSGICTLRTVYYFSDSANGQPTERCADEIKDNLLMGEVLYMGVGYTATGIIILLVWFIQYGLCCRAIPEEERRRRAYQRAERAQQRAENRHKNKPKPPPVKVYNPYI